MFKNILVKLLAFFARRIILKYRPDVVGITGSVGKTSSKEAIAAVLSQQFNVRASLKNYNNEVGLPLAVIGVNFAPGSSLWLWLKVFVTALNWWLLPHADYPEVLVLEMGADKPGDIKYLTDLASCKVGVLTAITHAHTEAFKTIKKIAQEKRMIVSHLSTDGFAVVNYDDELAREAAAKTKAEILTFGFNEGADLRASDINLLRDEKTGWPEGLNFKVSQSGHIVPVFLPGVAAEHLIYSALAGLAVGSVFGVNLVEGAQALAKLRPIPGHMRLLLGIKNTLIIDDSYNSSPSAANCALATLAKIPARAGARKFAVLGDMLELGPETANAHQSVGQAVMAHGVDYLITIGSAAKLISQAAQTAGLNPDAVASFSQAEEAGRFLQEKLKAGDIVLVKGSRGIHLEKVVKEVMDDPLRDQELLVDH